MHNTLFEKVYRFMNRYGQSVILFLDKAARSDIPAILILQEEVIVSIPQKDLFEKSTREEIEEAVEDKTAYILRDAKGKVVAFSLLIMHELGKRNLGSDLGYSLEEKRKTCVFDTVFANIAYRGYGIQQFFLWLAEEEAKRQGYKVLLATVANENRYSMDNFLKYGYTKERELIKYQDKKRWIVSKRL